VVVPLMAPFCKLAPRLGIYRPSHFCLVGRRSPRVSCFVVSQALMPLYWLCYHHNSQISVVIEPGGFPHSRSYACGACRIGRRSY
jgi:hypothetical protein